MSGYAQPSACGALKFSATLVILDKAKARRGLPRLCFRRERSRTGELERVSQMRIATPRQLRLQRSGRMKEERQEHLIGPSVPLSPPNFVRHGQTSNRNSPPPDCSTGQRETWNAQRAATVAKVCSVFIAANRNRFCSASIQCNSHKMPTTRPHLLSCNMRCDTFAQTVRCARCLLMLDVRANGIIAFACRCLQDAAPLARRDKKIEEQIDG